jgi:uncharacterized protein YbjQ (UPF0145 family)
MGRLVLGHRPRFLKKNPMIVPTTPAIEGKCITKYCGIVTGEVLLEANLFKDILAGIRDLVRVDLDDEVLGTGNGMLIVSASGTAVRVE